MLQDYHDWLADALCLVRKEPLRFKDRKDLILSLNFIVERVQYEMREMDPKSVEVPAVKKCLELFDDTYELLAEGLLKRDFTQTVEVATKCNTLWNATYSLCEHYARLTDDNKSESDEDEVDMARLKLYKDVIEKTSDRSDENEMEGT